MPHPSPSGCATLFKSAPRRRGGTERQGTRLSKTRLQRVARPPPCARLSFAVRGAAPVSLSSLKSPHYRRAGRSRGATPPCRETRKQGTQWHQARKRPAAPRTHSVSPRARALPRPTPHQYNDACASVAREEQQERAQGGGPRKRAQLRLFSAVEAWQQLRVGVAGL